MGNPKNFKHNKYKNLCPGSLFFLSALFLSGFWEQGRFLPAGGILTALTLFYFHAGGFLWALFVFFLSFHYGGFFFKGADHPFWPESLKYFWLFAVTAGCYTAGTLLRPYLISLPLLIFWKKAGFTPRRARLKRRIAEPGNVEMEKEFFSGKPNFKTLFSPSFPSLTQEEKSFLSNETHRLLEAADEWETVKTKDIPPRTMELLKKGKFLGMVIPKKYGGLGFSPAGQARVLQKVASVNIPAGIVTMVPNSLGAARLISRFGSQKQKARWLPLLADGREIPCFGLTEIHAGSDAGALSSEGVLFKGEDGKLKIKLSWSKRYVSLSAVSTLLCVVFRLKDPDNLLNRPAGPEIACALVPANTHGVKKGLYHDPMGLPFYNGPVEGRDVVLSAETALIGGIQQAGRGWEMLMECLTAGRGVSLPSICAGISQRTARAVSCYGKIRKQFGVPIGRFEGVEEKLSRIAGFTYLITAVQNFTLSGLNQGPVSSAVTKYNVTERVGDIVRDGMAVMGGAGLVFGPKNVTATAYASLPLAVIVEGANILIRSFVIFGQGFLRAFPLAEQGISAVEKNDLLAFDKFLSKSCYFMVCNFIRSVFLSLCRAGLSLSPFYLGTGRRALQKISWSVSLFSWLSGLAFVGWGVGFKKKEKLSGRFADILSHQYMAVALLWDWRERGRLKHSLPAVKWGLDYCFWRIQEALEGILLNLNKPVLFFPLNRLLYFLLRINPLGRPPSDKLSGWLAKALLDDKPFREDLTRHSYMPKDPRHPLHVLERARRLVEKTEPAALKIKSALQKKQLFQKRVSLPIEQALKKNIITREERDLLKEAEQACLQAVQTDTFTREEYLS